MTADRDATRRVLDVLPVDRTDAVEAVYTTLLGGDVAGAIQHAQELDVWLATHLTDLLDKLRLIDDRGAQAEWAASPLLTTIWR